VLITNVTAQPGKRENGKDGNNRTNGKKSGKYHLTTSVCSVISVFSVLSLQTFSNKRFQG
ncbi:MAG: hypothetical protein ACREAB_09930, partial [Blastocatellia bacterium]